MVTKTVFLWCVIAPITISWSKSYNHDWAVELEGDDVTAVASATDCEYKHHIIDNWHLFRCHHVQRRSIEADLKTHTSFTEHHLVKRADQQQVKSRQKRQAPGYWRMPPSPHPTYDSPVYEDLMHLNDQRWPLMWYLNRGHRLDMNVQQAWSEGVSGKGVVVTILDDGIERANPDLVANYDPEASYDVNQNDNDPTPRYDLIDSNRHGTRCAGEVAATANNSVCSVGVAFGAGIGGVRMLDGDVTDAVEARSLSLNPQHIDIYSASWGPDDDGKTVDGPGKLATRAFIQGITNGRSGKGSIFVWASGNGGRDHDNCNCDGYTNSIWTLSVSSATENGLIPWYSEACSSTMATTYSSGSSGERKIITTDLHNGCTSSHTGTSASAPLAAGIIALVLEAAPHLTWRDVQHITVRNCHVANLRATDWNVNAVGRNYSHSFGYGIMDTSAMVTMARTWVNVPEQKSISIKADIGEVSIPGKSKRSAKMSVTDAGDVKFLEHVQVHVTLVASRRGDVQLFATSPGGTRSQLLARRPHDASRAGFNDWPFLTVFSWGEQPIGEWELEVVNDGRYPVTLSKWSMTFHGTSTEPQAQPKPVIEENSKPPAEEHVQESNPPATEPPVYQPQVKPTPLPDTAPAPLEHCQVQASQSQCVGCQDEYYLLDGRCTGSCPEEAYFSGVLNRTAACIPCYYACKTCAGPNDYQCSSCYGDADLKPEGKNGQQFCHNKSLIFKVWSSSRWYYILSIGFLINFIIIIILIIYIFRWKQSKSKSSGLPRYSPVHREKAGLGKKTDSTVPFHDYESSDDEQAFVKRGFNSRPYTDDPDL